MSQYTNYLDFKESTIDALNQLPSHWEIKQVRYLLKDGAEGIKIGPFGSALKLEDMVESGFRVYGQENVIKKDFSLGKRQISLKKFLEMDVYRIFTNDILITMMGTSGKCEIVPEGIQEGIIDSHLLRVRVKPECIVPNFFKLLIDESPEIEYQIKTQGKGSIMHGLNSGIVKSLYLPIPPIGEQNLILAFLDHETAKIDTLIEKQQQLIELLKEKRQAVISHAVTKGLNPDAPMKDSGVEWLGEVPKHWGVTRIKHITHSFDQGWSPQCESRLAESNEYGVLKVGCVNGGNFNHLENKALPKDLEPRLQYLIKKDDLLISRANTKELVGSAAVVNDDYHNLILCDKLYRLKLTPSVSPQLLALYLSIPSIREQIELGASGASHSMQNISQDIIKELPCLIVPDEESKELLRSIEKKSKYFSVLINKSTLAISLMQERRTALISAAVTGKINVRNWVAPTTSSDTNEAQQEATA